jgi:predicted dinucleotide-binding enzyme
MRIAIIGSGNVGKALASAATKAGHHVTLSARSAEKAREVAQATNADAASSNRDAVKDAELVVLANIVLQIRNNWPWQNGWKLVGPPEE